MKEIIEWINSFSIGGKLSILWFLPITLLVLYSSTKLVKYSEVIIIKTKFGSAFVGGVLIAAITSIPELITEIIQSSSGHPSISIANDIGSNAFSVFLIGITSIWFVKKMFLKKLGKWSQISIFISFFVSLLITLAIYFVADISIGKKGIFIIGIVPMSMFFIYLITLFLQYKFGDSDEVTKVFNISNINVKKAIWGFSIWGIFVIVFSLFLNWTASSIRSGYNLDSKFIGGIFLSISTSSPEILVFFLFIKRKKPIAGIASLIGSHIFNMGITFFGDMIYTQGPTILNYDVRQNWGLGLITTIMLCLLFIQVILAKYTKIIDNKVFYVIIPTLISLTYIIGWVYIFVI